jgi:hypothetical protein
VIKMITWMIDMSGAKADVIAHVSNWQPSRAELKMIAVIDHGVEQDAADAMDRHELSQACAESLDDIERARISALAELELVLTQYAGVCVRYLDNPRHLGGYTLSVCVSAYEQDPRTVGG